MLTALGQEMPHCVSKRRMQGQADMLTALPTSRLWSFAMNHALFPRNHTSRPILWIAAAAIGCSLYALPAQGGDPSPRPNAAPPEGAKGTISLFTGKEDDLKTHWVKRGTDQPAAWKLVENGGMQVGGGDIATKQNYGDMQLHIEFRVPLMPDKKGQARGNSGIGLQGMYEVQVLDSFGFAKPGKGDCGAIYNNAAPLFNATKPPKEWQTYDIVFRQARFNEKGEKIENAHATVILNGILVQNNQEIKGPTGIGNGPENKPGPIVLQDHGNPVEYRNIWVLPLPDKGSDKYDPE